MTNSINNLTLRRALQKKGELALIKALDALEQLLPGVSFSIPNQTPGLYVQYFPADNKVYIGESSNVLREIRIYRTPFQLNNNPQRRRYFEKSGIPNVKDFSVCLSSDLNLNDKSVRLKEEKKLISLAGANCINVSVGPNTKKTEYKGHSGVIEPIFKPRVGSWKQKQSEKYYKALLPYENLPSKSNQSCIYLIYHIGTGNFYIGQSNTSLLGPRMLKHKTILRKSQYYKQQNIEISQYKTYERMIHDMQTHGPHFEYSIIEYLDQLSPEDRIKRETAVIADAIYRFSTRVYNVPNANVKDILRLLYRNVQTSKIAAGALRRRKTQPKAVGRIFYPVVIEGKWFSQVKYAAEAYSLNRKTVSFRLLSDNFPTWITLKDLTKKKLPNIPEIQLKAKQFFETLENYKT